MIFRFLGQTVRRAWPLLLAVWAALLVYAWFAAPPWDEFAQDKEFSFLPEDSPSRRAAGVYAEAFPENKAASNIVLVLYRQNRVDDTFDRDRTFIKDVLEPALREIAEAQGGLAKYPTPAATEVGVNPFAEPPPTQAKAKAPSIIWDIHTPNARAIGPLLISPDGKVMLVLMELTTEFLARANWEVIEQVQNKVAELKRQGQLPPGLDITVTGSAVIGRDHTLAELDSVRATEMLTVLMVVGLLIVIYRAPLLAIIPLATVVLVVQLSLCLLAMLARAGLITLFQGLQIYIIILAYGAGVDYCLFLTARYKEELNTGKSPGAAVEVAVGSTGAALVASAATVAGGIAMMLFAEFGKFRQAGLAIPLSLALVLIATLTFSPSLLRLAGRWAFWPRHVGPAAADPAAEAPEQPSLLQSMWDHVGHLLLRRPGWAWGVTVACMAPLAVVAFLFYNRLSYDVIGDLPADASSVVGTRVLQKHFPAGIIGEVTVLLVQPNVDFGTPAGRAVVTRVTDHLRRDRDELGLADIRTLTVPLGITQRAKNPLDDPELSPEGRERISREFLDHYAGTQDAHRRRTVTRLDLTLNQSPFSRWAAEDLDRIGQDVRNALPEKLQSGAQVYFFGTTASVRDLAAVTKRDRVRIELLVLGCVFLILVLLLRRVVVPVYLLLSVLFSYYVTLGTTFAVFWLLDPSGFTGIDWKVAIFLFTILIAVGEDYNIFLLSRVHEEERRFGPRRGVTEALTRTGPIISSCGIIMAGTFGSLLAGSLAEMKQLGFALAFGVLLDTFVVRPILVPAFLLLLAGRRQTLVGKKEEPPAEMPAAAPPTAGASS